MCQAGSTCYFASVQVLLATLRPFLEPLGVHSEILDYADQVYQCRLQSDTAKYEALCDVPPVWLRRRYGYIKMNSWPGLQESLQVSLKSGPESGGMPEAILLAALYSARNGVAKAICSAGKKGLAKTVDAVLYRKAPLPEDVDILLCEFQHFKLSRTTPLLRSLPFPGVGRVGGEWFEKTLFGAEHIVGGLLEVGIGGIPDHAIAFTLCHATKQLIICNTHGQDCMRVHNNQPVDADNKRIAYVDPEAPYSSKTPTVGREPTPDEIKEHGKWHRWTVSAMHCVATRHRPRDSNIIHPIQENGKQFTNTYMLRYARKWAYESNLPMYWALRGNPGYTDLL